MGFIPSEEFYQKVHWGSLDKKNFDYMLGTYQQLKEKERQGMLEVGRFLEAFQIEVPEQEVLFSSLFKGRFGVDENNTRQYQKGLTVLEEHRLKFTALAGMPCTPKKKRKLARYAARLARRITAKEYPVQKKWVYKEGKIVKI